MSPNLKAPLALALLLSACASEEAYEAPLQWDIALSQPTLDIRLGDQRLESGADAALLDSGEDISVSPNLDLGVEDRLSPTQDSRPDLEDPRRDTAQDLQVEDQALDLQMEDQALDLQAADQNLDTQTEDRALDLRAEDHALPQDQPPLDPDDGAQDLALADQAPPVDLASPVDQAASVDQGLPLRLIINELDYDQNGVDEGEFIELYNIGGAGSTSGWSLDFYSGSDDTHYGHYELRDVHLESNDLILIAAPAIADLSIPAEGLVIFRLDPNDPEFRYIDGFIQNRAEYIQLFNQEELVDSLGYEDLGPGQGAEGQPAPSDPSNADQSLNRCPDGADSDNNQEDFSLSSPSPGALNLCP